MWYMYITLVTYIIIAIDYIINFNMDISYKIYVMLVLIIVGVLSGVILKYSIAVVKESTTEERITEKLNIDSKQEVHKNPTVSEIMDRMLGSNDNYRLDNNSKHIGMNKDDNTK